MPVIQSIKCDKCEELQLDGHQVEYSVEDKQLVLYGIGDISPLETAQGAPVMPENQEEFNGWSSAVICNGCLIDFVLAVRMTGEDLIRKGEENGEVK